MIICINLLNTDKANEKYEFDWPKDNAANKIINMSISKNLLHYQNITNQLNLEMTAKNCFYAEWTFTIRQDIINFIQHFLNNLNLN